MPIHKLKFAGSLLLAVALTLTFVVMHADQMWSGSIDLAYHFSLIAYIADHHALPSGDVAYLVTMAPYPPAAHIAAALIGALVGSPLFGMQWVTLLSIFLGWLALGYLVMLGAARRGLVALVALALLVVLNEFHIHMEVLTNHVISNYFYAQLVGQAVALVLLASAARLRWRGHAHWRDYVLLGAGSIFLVCFHLVPAVELLAALCVLIVLDFASRANPRRFKTLLVGGGIVLASVVLILLNPYFASIVAVSQNNGSLPLTWAQNLNQLAVLCGLLLVVSSGLAIHWIRLRTNSERRLWVSSQYVAAAGLATALLCLLQIALYRYVGKGSEYAAYKYALALQTFLIAAVSLAIVALAGSWLRRSGELPGTSSPWAVACAAIFACIASTIGVPEKSVMSAHELETDIAAAHSYRDTTRSSNDDRDDLAININRIYPIGNYLISMSTLHASALSANSISLIRPQPFPEPEKLGNILTSIGNPPWDVKECRRSELANDIVVIDAACADRSFTIRCLGQYDFTTAGNIALGNKAISGFSHPEEEGAWTDGPEAGFVCAPAADPNNAPIRIAIHGRAFLTPGRSQRIEFVANGVSIKQVLFDESDPDQTVRLELPRPAGGTLDLRLRFPDAVSPEDLGLSIDNRKLGLRLRTITFEQ